jgi:pimeloyl-ACP methyl ester carboxylesterase
MFYQLYFQQPGVAAAELERDPRATFRKDPLRSLGRKVPRQGGLINRMAEPLVATELAPRRRHRCLCRAVARRGFRDGLTWHRNIHRSWELLAPFDGVPVAVPALYAAGDRDLVAGFPRMGQLIANLRSLVPQLRDTIMLPGCGHWTQQERPAEVNRAMIEFLRALP